MSEYTERLQDLARRIDSARSTFDLASKEAALGELEKELSAPDLWDDPEKAQRLNQRASRTRDEIEHSAKLVKQLDDLRAIDELLQESPDPELQKELDDGLRKLSRQVDRLELESLLSGEYDANDAIASIHAGAGGTESQDWAEMILRMYLRWAEREGFEAELDEVTPGEEAGIKSATIVFRGTNVYGLLSAERGVHRLVRISPFDASKRRHTSFASFDVIPMIPEDEEVDIDPKDLRIDTYRSSGAGGQHVNVTDSAVRITHIPTGIAAACQNERSQMQNRAVAMRILKARLMDLAREQRQDRIENLRGERRDIQFGSQIRSYVLHPYQMVKDHRTAAEIGDVNRVLDGDLRELIDSALRQRASAQSQASS
ncbi:MAG: peptide chain release factor 2 [Actinobacteria bacterium]|nr:peptide chain release factor 2 [Actinomycetota bacterium]